MKKSIILLIFLFSALGIFTVHAQQMNSYNMFHMDRYLQNPAAAGTKPYTFISCNYAKYWSGFNGSPSIQNVNVHSLVSERVAFGGKLYNENTGLSGKFGLEATYAYHIPITSGGSKFSFGLSARISQYKIFKDKFVLHDTDDEVIVYSQNSMISPDASAGISIYKENLFYIDIASHQLISPGIDYMNQEYLENKQVRHYYIGGGYNLNINEDLRIEPSVLLKLVETGSYQINGGVKVEFKKMISAGCYYVTNSAIVPFVGINLRNIALGYTYGIVTSEIAAHQLGNHEVMVIIKLNNAQSNLERD